MRYASMAAVAAVVAITAGGCRRSGEDVAAFKWTNDLPAGTVVHLRDGFGNITVQRAVGQTASITGSRRWRRGRSSDIHFVVNQIGKDYYICAMWKASGQCADSGYRGRQTGGFLSIFSLFHRGSDATADFEAALPANVVLDARTSNGSVTIDGLTAGVSARTANGTVRAVNVAGPLELTTTNGDVRLSTDALAANDPVKLTTTNGTVRAELPANLQGQIDLSVVNGGVRSDFLVPATGNKRVGRRLSGQIGTSTRTIKLRAVNGLVSLTSLGGVTPAAPTAR